MATLAQLSYFVTVCECANMTRAAELAHVSQPAITKTIKDLENEYGTQLIIRSKSGQTITAEGKLLYRQALKVLASERELDEAMRKALGTQQHLRVGTSALFMKLYPRFFQDFKAAYPQIETQHLIFGSLELTHYLENGKLDVAIVGTTKGVRAHSRPLVEQDVRLWANKQHKLAQKRVINLKTDLKDVPVALFCESAPGMIDAKIPYNSPFRPYVPEQNVTITTNQLGLIQETLSDNNAVSLLPAGVFAGAPNLVSLPITPPCSFTLAVYWTSDNAVGMVTDFITFASSYRSDYHPEVSPRTENAGNAG